MTFTDCRISLAYCLFQKGILYLSNVMFYAVLFLSARRKKCINDLLFCIP